MPSHDIPAPGAPAGPDLRPTGGQQAGTCRGEAGELHDPPLLVSRGPRRLTKLVLFPVRFLFTAETGRVGTNALAADHYLASARAPVHELVTAALAWRLEPPTDTDKTAALLGKELLPLYLHYIDAYITRLHAIDHHRLADSFQRWRARLLS